jgi:hypothetical protein
LELSPIFGDDRAGQAAAVAGRRSVGLAMTSIMAYESEIKDAVSASSNLPRGGDIATYYRCEFVIA